jgi:hypothetical protein
MARAAAYQVYMSTLLGVGMTSLYVKYAWRTIVNDARALESSPYTRRERISNAPTTFLCPPKPHFLQVGIPPLGLFSSLQHGQEQVVVASFTRLNLIDRCFGFSLESVDQFSMRPKADFLVGSFP